MQFIGPIKPSAWGIFITNALQQSKENSPGLKYHQQKTTNTGGYQNSIECERAGERKQKRKQEGGPDRPLPARHIVVVGAGGAHCDVQVAGEGEGRPPTAPPEPKCYFSFNSIAAAFSSSCIRRWGISFIIRADYFRLGVEVRKSCQVPRTFTFILASAGMSKLFFSVRIPRGKRGGKASGVCDFG